MNLFVPGKQGYWSEDACIVPINCHQWSGIGIYCGPAFKRYYICRILSKSNNSLIGYIIIWNDYFRDRIFCRVHPRVRIEAMECILVNLIRFFSNRLFLQIDDQCFKAGINFFHFCIGRVQLFSNLLFINLVFIFQVNSYQSLEK